MPPAFCFWWPFWRSAALARGHRRDACLCVRFGLINGDGEFSFAGEIASPNHPEDAIWLVCGRRALAVDSGSVARSCALCRHASVVDSALYRGPGPLERAGYFPFRGSVWGDGSPLTRDDPGLWRSLPFRPI